MIDMMVVVVAASHRLDADVPLLTPFPPSHSVLSVGDPADAVEATIFEVMDQVCADAALVARVAGVGITNHRESVIVWDRASGRPLTRVVVWSDTRTASVVDEMAVRAVEAGLADDAGFSSDNDEDIYADPSEVGRDALRSICGLPFSTYFSAVKIRWLMQVFRFFFFFFLSWEANWFDYRIHSGELGLIDF